MLELGIRVKHKVKGWFAKTEEHVTARPGLIKVAIEDLDRSETTREEDLELPSDEDNQARLFREMVKYFLKAAERRFVREWKAGEMPTFGDGNPFTLTYTAPFEAADIATLAKRIGFSLPKVLLIQTTGLR